MKLEVQLGDTLVFEAETDEPKEVYLQEYEFTNSYMSDRMNCVMRGWGPMPPPKPKPAKLPLGLRPRRIHDEERVLAIIEAMRRYVSVGRTVPSEWVVELSLLTGGE